jgi:hypothetical protein
MWLKYSDAPILTGEQWDRRQSGRPMSYAKPSGFWITDDSEECWRSWCVGEQFNLECLTHRHEVILDERNILILRSALQLDIFTKEFETFQVWGPDEEPRKYRDRCIDWGRVAEWYDGLIVTPYQWSRRMADGFSWYYGWDCASGCIWKAAAILEVRLIEIDYDVARKRDAEAA